MKTDTLGNFVAPFADEITDVLVIIEYEAKIIPASYFVFTDKDGESCDFSEATQMLCGFAGEYDDLKIDLDQLVQHKDCDNTLYIAEHGVSLRFLTTINLAKYITD